MGARAVLIVTVKICRSRSAGPGLPVKVCRSRSAGQDLTAEIVPVKK